MAGGMVGAALKPPPPPPPRGDALRRRRLAPHSHAVGKGAFAERQQSKLCMCAAPFPLACSRPPRSASRQKQCSPGPQACRAGPGSHARERAGAPGRRARAAAATAAAPPAAAAGAALTAAPAVARAAALAPAAALLARRPARARRPPEAGLPWFGSGRRAARPCPPSALALAPQLKTCLQPAANRTQGQEPFSALAHASQHASASAHTTLCPTRCLRRRP